MALESGAGMGRYGSSPEGADPFRLAVPAPSSKNGVQSAGALACRAIVAIEVSLDGMTFHRTILQSPAARGVDHESLNGVP